MRYRTTERLGVNKAEAAFLKYEWIFRDQPLVDVGVDAVVEKSDKGTPCGKFLAVQIKTGKSHFTIKDSSLTLYDISNVHYHYWLNLNIPIILVAYLPETDEIYWSQISKGSLKKAKKNWKLKISKSKVFDSKNKKEIEKILEKEVAEDFLEKIYLEDFENGDHSYIRVMSESSESMNRIHQLALSFNKKLYEMSSIKNVLPESDPKFKTKLKVDSNDFFAHAKRLLSELSMFSEFYASDSFTLTQLIYYLQKNNALDHNFIKSVKETPDVLDRAIVIITKLRDTALGLPTKYPDLKKKLVIY